MEHIYGINIIHIYGINIIHYYVTYNLHFHPLSKTGITLIKWYHHILFSITHIFIITIIILYMVIIISLKCILPIADGVLLIKKCINGN